MKKSVQKDSLNIDEQFAIIEKIVGKLEVKHADLSSMVEVNNESWKIRSLKESLLKPQPLIVSSIVIAP